MSHGSFSRVIIMFSYKSFASLHCREIYTYTRRSFSFHSVRLFTRDYVMKDRCNTELFDASAVARFVRSENRHDCWICQEIITDLTSHPVYSSIRERWLLPAYYIPANDNSFSNTVKPYSTVLIHRQSNDFQVFIDLMTNRRIFDRIRIHPQTKARVKSHCWIDELRDCKDMWLVV